MTSSVDDTDTPRMRGIILYGPPASGKDTITAALTELDPRIQLFRRLKVGSGNTAPYRMITWKELDQLRAGGNTVWENNRYGNTYAVDHSTLETALRNGTPVVHLGQPEAIGAVRKALPNATWFTVELRCSRSDALRRLQARGHGTPPERMTAWDETDPLPAADLLINTSRTSARTAAVRIIAMSLTEGAPAPKSAARGGDPGSLRSV